jgi:hypothetical protein
MRTCSPARSPSLYVQTCCLILGINSEEKIAKIRDTSVDEGRGDPSRTIREIRAYLKPWDWR